MNIIGNVEGRNCVIMDDMVDTAGTLSQAAEALKGKRSQDGRCLLHPSRSFPVRPSRELPASSLDELVVTDTIPLSDAARQCPKIRQLSCAELLAETLKRINTGDSVMSLLNEMYN